MVTRSNGTSKGAFSHAVSMIFIPMIFISTMFMSVVISGQVQSLEMKQAYVRLMPPNTPTTAVFGELHNDSEQAVTIVSARLQGADKVEIHTHVQVEGMMRMRKVEDGLVLKKGGYLALKSGGYHLMVFGFTQPEKQDLPLKLTLLDADGKAYEFQVSLGRPLQISAESEPSHQHEHHNHADKGHQSQSNDQTHQHKHEDASQGRAMADVN